jgi:hypothetical protein
MVEILPLEKLEALLSDTSGIYVGEGVDEDLFFAELADDVRRHRCDPFKISAVVMPPGFPDEPIGSVISGVRVARRDGYWLVYQPEHDYFCCFWGSDLEHLGAHGVFGGPLYCWSA